MDGFNPDVEAYKIRVTQEYDVYLYFAEGTIFENTEDKVNYIVSEATDLALNEDGLVAKTHEESDTQNGYIAFIATYEPKPKIVYHTEEMPKMIKAAMAQQGLL